MKEQVEEQVEEFKKALRVMNGAMQDAQSFVDSAKPELGFVFVPFELDPNRPDGVRVFFRDTNDFAFLSWESLFGDFETRQQEALQFQKEELKAFKRTLEDIEYDIAFCRTDISVCQKMSEGIPAEAVIDKLSLESRVRSQKEKLASLLEERKIWE